MKKTCISIALILIIALSAIMLAGKGGGNERYLRIHIRADSNDARDQSIKMQVKEIVVEYLTETVLKSRSKEELVKNIEDEIPAINGLIDGFLAKNGFDYKASTRINEEYFPLRVYGDTTLDEGYYDAVIIELGSGKGDNWWCVVYPPLCFTDQKNVRYRSLIYEYVKKYF